MRIHVQCFSLNAHFNLQGGVLCAYMWESTDCLSAEVCHALCSVSTTTLQSTGSMKFADFKAIGVTQKRGVGPLLIDYCMLAGGQNYLEKMNCKTCTSFDLRQQDITYLFLICPGVVTWPSSSDPPVLLSSCCRGGEEWAMGAYAWCQGSKYLQPLSSALHREFVSQVARLDLK